MFSSMKVLPELSISCRAFVRIAPQIWILDIHYSECIYKFSISFSIQFPYRMRNAIRLPLAWLPDFTVFSLPPISGFDRDSNRKNTNHPWWLLWHQNHSVDERNDCKWIFHFNGLIHFTNSIGQLSILLSVC